MGLSKGYEDFRKIVLAYVKNNKIPQGYPTLQSFKDYIDSKTAADIYYVKRICLEELDRNTSQFEAKGLFKYELMQYAFPSYTAQATENTECRNRLNSIISTPLDELKVAYEAETRKDTERDILLSKLSHKRP